MALDALTYALSRKYTDSVSDSLGSLKGAPCTIKSTEETDEGTIITFEWTGTSGTTETTQITIKNGKDGSQTDLNNIEIIQGTL